MVAGCLADLLGVPVPFDAEHRLVTSPLLPSGVLAGIRLLLGLYIVVTLIVELVWNGTQGTADSFFSYFTNLSFIGQCACFWASGVQTALYTRKDRKWYPLQQWPRFLQFLHTLLLTTVLTFPFIVTIVFWGLLSSPGIWTIRMTAWSNVSAHAMNSGFALFEILFTNVPPLPWLHMPILVVLLGAYLAVAYITYQTQGIYVYNFLDPKRQGSMLAAYIVGIAVGACMLFTLVHFAMFLRVKITPAPKTGATISEKATATASPAQSRHRRISSDKSEHMMERKQGELV